MTAVVTATGLALGGLSEPDALRAGEVPVGAVDPAAVLGRRGLLYRDRATQLALCAAFDALRAGGILDGTTLTVPGERFGVVASSVLGNLDTVCRAAEIVDRQGAGSLSPMGLPNASSNVVASSVSIRFGLRGPNLMVCNGRAGGLDAVHLAALLVRADRADRVLVVGAETRNEVVDRLLGDGEDVLDGAVALLVESPEAAAQRGAEVLGRVGAHARAADLERCVAGLDAGGLGRPAVWLTPERYAGTTPERLATAPRQDLSASLGRCYGALGVLQCATALSWLAATGADHAVATAGGDGGEAVAGLVLTAPGRPA